MSALERVFWLGSAMAWLVVAARVVWFRGELSSFALALVAALFCVVFCEGVRAVRPPSAGRLARVVAPLPHDPQSR